MDVLNRDGTSAVHYLVRAQGLLVVVVVVVLWMC